MSNSGFVFRKPGPLHHDDFCPDPGELEDQRAGVLGDGPGRHRAPDDDHQVLASHQAGQD